MSHFTQEQIEEIRLIARIEAKRLLRRVLMKGLNQQDEADIPGEEPDLTAPK